MTMETLPAAPDTRVTLFGSANHLDVLAQASAIARTLTGVLRRNGLLLQIKGKDRPHVLVEGWTLLGSMLGVFAEIAWTNQLPNGWEARAIVKTLGGIQIGAADAMCLRSEWRWQDRDDYQLRSMAQTRAIAKGLRIPLGFIVELAGYSATPAEELADTEALPQPRRSLRSAEGLRHRIRQLADQRGLDDARLQQLAQQAGVTGDRANVPQLRAILRAIESMPDEPQPQESSDEPRIAGDPETGIAY